ncbi:MAG: hypothetical protein AAFU85_00310 [Planctomycetota bacterium]
MKALGQLAIAILCGVLVSEAVAEDLTDRVNHRPSNLRVLNQRKLRIPFTADPKSSDKTVRLYVSTDRGVTWRVGAEQAPHATELVFEGTEDGEHWFALATADVPVDPKELSVQQRVLIDSVGPKIDLNATADTGGTLTGNVRLTDPSEVAALRLLYATDVHRQWRTIANQSIDRDGRFKIPIREDWRKLSIHVTATDSLGHVSVEAKTVERPRVASTFPSTGFATHASRRHGGEVPAQLADGPNHPDNLFLNQQLKPASAQGGEPTSPKPSQLPAGGLPAKLTPDGIEVIPAPPPAEAPSEFQTLPAPKNQAVTPETPPSNPTPGPITKPAELPAPVNDRPPASPSETAPQQRSRTLAEALRPMSEAPTPSSEPAAESIPTPAPSETPEDRRRYRADRAELESRALQNKFDLAQQLRDLPIRYSNSNRFSLDYELEAVGATGLEAVELYGSLDGGKTWKRWGADPDKRSPFDIETKGEGVFGFRVVVLGNNGLASPRPLDGDPPDIAIVVDQTAPRVKITSARYGEGDRTGSLEIRYDCDDENLMSRPVSIAFSESLQGPWSTIVSGLRNDGLYVWPADPKVPRQIYLRIDATDQSGNRGKYLLDQPIETQGLAPRAKILGLRSR